MFGGIFSSKVVHDLVGAVWPKGLYSLAIPAVQLLWHQWQEKRPDNHRKILRLKVKELDEYVKTVPAGSVEYEDAIEERSKARAELLMLVVRSAGKSKQKRQEIRDNLATAAELLQRDEALDPGLRHDADRAMVQLRAQLTQYGGKRGGEIAVEFPLASGLPAEAQSAMEGPPIRRRAALRTALLLYSPRSVWGWVTHALFFLGIVVTGGLLGAVLSGPSDQDDTEGLIGWIILTFLFRGFAYLTDRSSEALAAPQRRKWQTALLWYRPHGVVGWITHSLFFTGIVFTLAMTIDVLSGNRDEDDIDALIAWAVLTVLFWGLGILQDRRTSAATVPQKGMRSWLLLYAPEGIVAWILHLLFYLVLAVTLIGVPGGVADGETDTLYAIPVFVALLVIIRYLARRSSSPPRLQTEAAVSTEELSGPR